MKYQDIKKPETIKGVKEWKNPNNNFEVLMIHYTADPEKDPDREGKEWYENEKAQTPKDVWEKEYDINFKTKAGKLVFGKEFCDFDPNTHFIKSFNVEGTKMITLDFGQSNPNAGLIAVYDKTGTLYIIDEYFEPAIPSVASREMFKKFSYLFWNEKAGEPHTPESIDALPIEDKRNLAYDVFQTRVIDPTTRHKNRVSKTNDGEIPYSIIEEFFDHGWDFEPGNNDIDAGITRIREYFNLDKDGNAGLYIFYDKCPNLCREIENYRYKELSKTQEKNYNQPDVPVKKDEHGIDALRYLILTMMILPSKPKKKLTKIQKDIQSVLRPTVLDAEWDID